MHDEPNVGHWLLLLRDGTEAEQQLARTELGLILEARGLLDDAAEAYERNVAEGTTDRRPYERLAAIARQRGDAPAEARALRALAELLAPTPAPPPAPSLPNPERQNPEYRAALVPLIPHADAEDWADSQDTRAPADADGADEGVADPEAVSGADIPDDEASHATVVAAPEHEASVEPEAATELVDDVSPDDVSTSESAPTSDDEPALAVGPDVAEDDDSTASQDAGVTVLAEQVEAQDTAVAADEPEFVAAVPADASALADASPVADASAPDDAHSPAEPVEPPTSDQSPPVPGHTDDPPLTPTLHSEATPSPNEARQSDVSPLSRAQGEGAGVRASSDPLTDAEGNTRVRPVFSRLLPTLIGLVLVVLVVGGALMIPVSRPLSVTPATPVPSPSVVTQQRAAAVQIAQVVPSPSPSPPPALSTPVAQPTVAQQAAASPTAVPAPLDARCADVGLRFPEARNSEAAVRAAFREYMARQGVTIDPASTLFAGLAEAHAARHAEVIAGWMAVTLQRERRGLPTFPLVDYVASDIIVAAGPGEYQLRATISPQGWSELRALPSDSCEGAFLANPDNARWVEQMQASVGDITWALPTPQPRR